jgi:hypothetical protein
MEPLNKSDRSMAVNKFLGFYAISLLAVILTSYFLFNTPAGIYKNKLRNYKASEDEQERLLGKIDVMTSNLINLVQVDKNYLSSTNEIDKGNLETRISQFQKNISNGLVDVQNDSMSYVSTIARRNSFNYINSFNTILSYRNTISSLQNSFAEKGNDATELMKVNADLNTCKLQLQMATTSLAAANSNKPAPSGGGGSSAKEAQLQQQLDRCQTDLATCQKAKTGNEAVVPVQTPTVSDESKKALVLFQAGQDLYNTAQSTKNLFERRGVLYSAKQLFLKSSASYPDADKVNKAIYQIDIELKKLMSMG